MKKYIAIFREPDGRTDQHTDNQIAKHGDNWKAWMEQWGQQGKLKGGSSLTLTGRIIKGDGNIVLEEIYKNGTEIVGGYLLLEAESLDEVTAMMKTCPIYEFGGYTEIRELQGQR